MFQANVELIEYPVDGLVDNIIQALRPMVEGRHRRHNHRPQLRSLHQQSQMAKMERSLPHAEHQRTTLLQHHIRRPRQQTIRVAMDNTRERFH